MSMTYNAILEAIEKTGDTSILSLFNSILCNDKDSISEFRADQYYNTGDKVYIYRNEYPYHFFYECKRDKVYGVFKASNWTDLSTDPKYSNKDARCIGEVNIITRIPDGTKRYILNELDAALEKEFMIFSGDELIDSETYIISNNNIVTFLGQISQSRKLTFLVFDVRGNEKYNYHKEYNVDVQSVYGQYIEINDTILKDDKFIVMSKSGVVDERYYKVYREEGEIAIYAMGIDTTVTVHHLSYRSTNSVAPANNVIHDRIAIDSNTDHFSVGINHWDLMSDSILIFSRALGPIPVRKIMYNNKVLTLKDMILPAGDIVEVFAFLKDRRKEKTKISMTDLNESIIKSFEKLTTTTYIFEQGSSQIEINLEDLNLKDSFTVVPSIVTSSGGDVSFSISNVTTTSMIVKYTGLAETVEVVFEIITK